MALGGVGEEMNSDDAIHVSGLVLTSHIGVSDGERATPQRLTVSLTLHPSAPFTGLNDNIKRTIDYARVCATVQQLAADYPRCLIETLAQDIAMGVFEHFPSCAAIDVDLRKYILPDTQYVAVRVSRQRPTGHDN